MGNLKMLDPHHFAEGREADWGLTRQGQTLYIEVRSSTADSIKIGEVVTLICPDAPDGTGQISFVVGGKGRPYEVKRKSYEHLYPQAKAAPPRSCEDEDVRDQRESAAALARGERE